MSAPALRARLVVNPRISWSSEGVSGLVVMDSEGMRKMMDGDGKL